MGTSNSLIQEQVEQNNNQVFNQNLLNSIYSNNNSIIPSYNLEDYNNSNQLTSKKTKAYKNYTIIKRSSLKFEKDAMNHHLYYITFEYDSEIDFDLNIYLNARKEANIIVPSKSFVNKVLSIHCVKGEKIKFNNPSAYFDGNFFFENKIKIENSYDLILEAIPKKKGIEFILLTYCNVSEEEVSGRLVNKICSISQEIKVLGIWYKMNDVFGIANDTYSNECEICCAVKKNSVFLPCKHSYACNNCAQNLRIRRNPCPICRNPINDLLIIENQDNIK